MELKLWKRKTDNYRDSKDKKNLSPTLVLIQSAACARHTQEDVPSRFWQDIGIGFWSMIDLDHDNAAYLASHFAEDLASIHQIDKRDYVYHALTTEIESHQSLEPWNAERRESHNQVCRVSGAT